MVTNSEIQSTPNAKDVSVVESALGYYFEDRSHLILALTHSSFAHESSATHLASNERLEFLGDAVLGLIVTRYLYQTYPLLSEGKLSVMKSRLVSGGILGKMARTLNMGKFLLLGRGEEKLGGRLRKSMLARTLEAIIGAIFLDGGLEKSEEIVLRLLNPELMDIRRSMSQYDYKSQLQKLTQNMFGMVPAYDLVSQTGPDHGRVFRVRARVKEQISAVARGTSKKSAEQRAARLVLRKLEKQPLKAQEIFSETGVCLQDSNEVNGGQ